MKRILTFLSLLMFSTWIVAIATEYKVTHISTAEGLSNNTVRRIMQDSHGFLWFATPDGLNCYDGNTFRTFYNNIHDKVALNDNHVRNIIEDNNGHLWIYTSLKRVNCYDLHLERFIDISNGGKTNTKYWNSTVTGDSVWLYGTSTGCLLVTFDGEKPHTVSIGDKYKELSSIYVNSIEQGTHGMWICTEKGLYSLSGDKLTRFAQGENFLRYIRHKKSEYFLTTDCSIVKNGKVKTTGSFRSAGGFIGSITHDNLWLLYFTDGQAAYDFTTDRFVDMPVAYSMESPVYSYTDNMGGLWISNSQQQLLYISNDKSPVSNTKKLTKRFCLMPQGHTISTNEYLSVHHGKNGKLWIATYGNGLWMYDTKTDLLQHFTTSASSPIPLMSDLLKYVFEDNTGALWIGYFQMGASIAIPVSRTYSKYVYPCTGSADDNLHQQIRMVTPLANGNLLASNMYGKLFTLSLDGNGLTPVLNNSLLYNTPYCTITDTYGHQWMGTKGGGLIVNSKTYRHINNDESSLSNNNVYDIIQDKKGRIWIATFGGGLNLITTQTLKLANSKNQKLTFRHFFGSQAGIKTIRHLCMDKNGYIWMATDDGMVAFDPDHLENDANNYHHYSISSDKTSIDEIRTIYCDSHGRIWASEVGKGVAMCHPTGNYDKMEFLHLGIRDGLVNPIVQSIIEDKLGYLWFATEHGMSVYNPKTQSFDNYFFSKEMASNIYAENSTCSMSDGRLVFGTNNGLLVTDPTKVRHNIHPNALHLTGVKIDGKPFAWDYANANHRRSFTTSGVQILPTIKLPNGFSTFAVTISTFNYSALTKPKYSYWLEGSDNDEWSTPSELSEIMLSGLSAGHYTLHVKLCGAQGQKAPEMLLPVYVEYPWWLSWWGIALAIIISMAIVFAVRKFTIRHREMEEEIDTRKASEAKLQKIIVTNIKDGKEVESASDVFLKQFNKVIQESMSDPNVTAETIAIRMNMGHTQFYNRVKASTGSAPKEYLRTLRMKRAAELLVTTDLNVSEIAYQVGFSEMTYFSKAFKAQFGMSPSIYKKNNTAFYPHSITNSPKQPD